MDTSYLELLTQLFDWATYNHVKTKLVISVQVLIR